MKCEICGVDADSVSGAMWLGVMACRSPACQAEAKRLRSKLYDEIFAKPFTFEKTSDAIEVKHMFARFGRAIMDTLPDGTLKGRGVNPLATSPFWWGEMAEERVLPLVPERYLSMQTRRGIFSSGEFEVIQPIPAEVWETAFRGSGMLAE
jgi:hypothetical protein